MAEQQAVPTSALEEDLPKAVQAKGYTCGAAALLVLGRDHGVGQRSEGRIGTDIRFTKHGSAPKHVLRVVTKYGLAHQELRGVAIEQLRMCFELARPVMVMLQFTGSAAPSRASR